MERVQIVSIPPEEVLIVSPHPLIVIFNIRINDVQAVFHTRGHQFQFTCTHALFLFLHEIGLTVLR